MKTLVDIIHNRTGHWVGDGFPVRSLFSYQGDTKAISPFLLFDYAGPYLFEPNDGAPRGVGEHPHRGFETVTIANLVTVSWLFRAFGEPALAFPHWGGRYGCCHLHGSHRTPS